jgi:hypothetical protein
VFITPLSLPAFKAQLCSFALFVTTEKISVAPLREHKSLENYFTSIETKCQGDLNQIRHRINKIQGLFIRKD